MGSLTDVQIKQWIKAKEPVAKADGEGLTVDLHPNLTRDLH